MATRNITPAMAGNTPPSIRPARRAVAAAVQHLAGWLDHHMGSRPPSRRSAARITYVGSSAPTTRGDQALPACPACGCPLGAADEAVVLRGDVYHAACSLYQPRRQAA
jgi:hypothetical protein